jgi:hypothetical protein
MNFYLDKGLKAVGLAATVAIVGVISLVCAGPAQGNKVTDDLLTAEQCIDNNTAGSVEPFEEELVAEGLVSTELNKIPITHGMCEEIIERTPGGSPIARAAVVGNLTQELQIIKKSMEDASGKDVNGDGMVNEEDKKTAESASFAAARAAQETLRRATEQGSTDGGGIGELDVELAAYLQDVVQGQYDDGGGRGDNVSGGGGGGGTASATASATANATANAGGGGGGGGVEGAQATVLPSREYTRTNASGAALEKGADKKAAAGGGQCAATVSLTDGTLELLRGRATFDPPPKELHWKAHERTHLVMAPKALVPIEQLKQDLDQAGGAAEAEAHCMQLGSQMEALYVPDDDLDITALDKPKKEVQLDKPTTWSWDIGANVGASELDSPHLLSLNVTAYVYSPEQGGGSRAIPQDPPLFDDYINVSATWWEVFTDFVARNWPVLVPIFLTILTAIIIPFVLLPWWRRRHQPDELRDRSSGVPRDDRWI